MLEVDVHFGDRDNLVGAEALIEHQAPEIVQVSMLRSAGEVLLLLDHSQNVDPDRILVRGDLHVANRIFPSPVLLDGMAEEFRQGVEIMTQCDVANFVLFHSPSFIGLDPRLVDEAHRLASEKLFRTCEARCDPTITVRMSAILHFGPTQELLRRVSELADLDPAVLISALAQCSAMFRLLVHCLSLVSFCGGQVCGFGVPLAVQFEVVMPHSAPDPQCHRCPLHASVSRSTRRPEPPDTRFFFPL
jgi:hypothetical protein